MHRRWRSFRRSLKKLGTKEWIAIVVLATKAVELVHALFSN
jgi:hypothetical protein